MRALVRACFWDGILSEVCSASKRMHNKSNDEIIHLRGCLQNFAAFLENSRTLFWRFHYGVFNRPFFMSLQGLAFAWLCSNSSVSWAQRSHTYHARRIKRIVCALCINTPIAHTSKTQQETQTIIWEIHAEKRELPLSIPCENFGIIPIDSGE